MARVLIAEDDVTTLETTALLLRSEGYETGTAESGRACLAQVLAAPFDLLLSDLSLGDMDAIELLDRMRHAGIDVPMVVMTAFGTIETAVRAIQRGAVDFAEKPLIGEELLARVARGLALGSAKRGRVTTAPVAQAGHRWARLLVTVLSSPTDIRSVEHWARVAGISSSTLRDWCRLAGTSAGQSLAFGRLLRAVVLSRDHEWDAARYLDVSDPRTLRHLLARAGLPNRAPRVSMDDLLARQSFLGDASLLQALRRALKELSPGPLTRTRT